MKAKKQNHEQQASKHYKRGISAAIKRLRELEQSKVADMLAASFSRTLQQPPA